MGRRVIIAAGAASLLIPAMMLLCVRLSEPGPFTKPGLVAKNIATAAPAASTGGEGALERSPGRPAAVVAEQEPAPGVAGELAGGAGGGSSRRSGGGVAPKSAKSLPMQGEVLTRALETAIEEQDLARLQGLLISGLTLEGTRFGEGDLPLLFEALLAVDDHGLQKLALTHLQRVQAPPEVLVDGYFGYIEGAAQPVHAEEIFKHIGKIGGDAAVSGLEGFIRRTADEKLRGLAAGALGGIKDLRGVPVLREALFSAPEPGQAKPYALALARIGGVEAAAGLVDYSIREGHEAALPFLREIRDPAAAPIIAAGLDSRSTDAYRREALRALGSLAEPATLPELRRFLLSARGPLLAEAIGALGRFRDPRAAEILEDFAARHPDQRLSHLALRNAQKVQRSAASPRG